MRNCRPPRATKMSIPGQSRCHRPRQKNRSRARTALPPVAASSILPRAMCPRAVTSAAGRRETTSGRRRGQVAGMPATWPLLGFAPMRQKEGPGSWHASYLAPPSAALAQSPGALVFLVALLAALAANVRHVLAVFADGFATFFADLGHMLAIFADSFAALAACLAGLFGGELVSSTLLVSRLAALAGNLALLLLVHGRKSAIARIAHKITPFHRLNLFATASSKTSRLIPCRSTTHSSARCATGTAAFLSSLPTRFNDAKYVPPSED